MAPTKEQKKEISGYIRKWRSILFLNQWHFETDYFHEDHEAFAAEIHMQTEYMTARVSINPRFWKEDQETRERMIVHELCHCVAQPLVQLACDAGNGCAVSAREIDHWKEYVTQHITNAVFYK